MSGNAEWLAQVVEDPIDPEMPICDPHHHLWEFRNERVWHRYLMDEIQADLKSGHNITSTVFIECGAMYKRTGPTELRVIGETEFVNGVAAMSASGLYGETRVCAGIIGNADFCLGSPVAAVLEAHEAAGGGRFRGIRHQAAWDAASDHIPIGRNVRGPHTYMDPKFREGFAELVKRDYSFEALVYHPQMPELLDLARAFPDARIVLNHFGCPLGIGPYAGKQAEIFPVWKEQLRAISECPNVVAKLGGLVMELNGFGFHEQPRPPTSAELADATKDYYEHTLDCFGVERCMFESNFPVDKVSASYTVIWNSFQRLAANYSAAEKAALFHDNAVAFYRLDETA